MHGWEHLWSAKAAGRGWRVSLHRALAIARKEFRHILRDPRTFFLVAVSPAFLLLILSYIFAFDVERVDLALWDLDQSALSRQYVAALTADGDLHIRRYADSYQALDQLFLAGQVNGALVIPAGFEQALRAGQPFQIEAVIDGSDPIAANQAVASLSQRTAVFASRFQSPLLSGGGLELRSTVWYNPALKSLVSMVPGLSAVVLSMPALALALALAREKEAGSFEGLIVTPVRGAEYLLGKLSAYLSTGLLSVLLAWLVAVAYFRVPFRGNLALYFLLASIYLLASMGFSLLVANFARSQQTAMFLVLLIFFVPSFFVAGLIYPVSHGHLGSQLVAYSLPTTHFIAISRSIFLKGTGFAPLWLRALALLGMGLGGLCASLFLFKKRLR